MKLICLLIGYCFGNFLTAEIVAKKYMGKSAAEIGSGNPGMANIMGNVGKKEGFLVLAGDIGKTLLAFVVTWLIAGDALGKSVILRAGMGVLLGHNFPVWKKFKGGKGVTVTCTWLIILMPVWGTLSCVIGGIVTLISGYLPLGAVVISLLAVLGAYFSGESGECVILLLVSLGIMAWKHRKGLWAIIKGEEKRRFRKKN